VEAPAIKSFYRVAKTNLPTDDDYMTPLECFGPPPDDLDPEQKKSWDAYSAFDTPEGAIKTARRFRRLGKYIFRYDIPEGAGLTSEQSIEPGHYDLRGDKEILKQCLVACVATLEAPVSRE
jgi:hypothetical protein